MSNIIKFPKAKRSFAALDFDYDKIKAAMPKAATLKVAFLWLWLIVRLLIFFVMYWLRLPIILVCNMVSIPMLFAWLFALYAFPDKHAMVWGFGIISFLGFLIAWMYDFILMAISPQDMERRL
ncbi:hypothetical protein [Xylella fastidiosa]|uniref:Transmembrane protein n=3 Tax=Xylella fastidiosa TaxID=2371 RepID=A0AAJ5UJK6_XYLFS|nr:hypothetical protein [Xylella fastidiosa]WCF29592.1 hypothetical protein OK117_12420 [Xylella fastidiosa subsp. fastidiosa]